MKNEKVVIEKQSVKTNNMLSRLATMYNRIKKIEIRNLFSSMSEILNGYKREYGNLIIDIQHVDKPVSDLQAGFASDAQHEIVEKKISKRILVSVRTVKNNMLLGIFNHTLPPRIFSRLKKEEDAIKNRQNELMKKRDMLVSKLEESQAEITQVSETEQTKGKKSAKKVKETQVDPKQKTSQYKKSINQMITTLKKSKGGKKLLEDLKADPDGKELLNILKHPETFAPATEKEKVEEATAA